MITALLCVAAAAVEIGDPPTPPKADQVPHVREIHGRTIQDPYFWLRERENPKVIEHLKAENAYFDSVTAGQQGLRKALYDEMLSHIKQTDMAVPYREHGWWYYSRTEEGKPYPIYCRRRGTMEAPEEVMLDVNALAAGRSFLIARPIAVSPDGKVMAYGEDWTGARVFTVRFKDLESGKLLKDVIEGASADLVWCADSANYVYTTVDAAVRADRAWRRKLGSSSMEALLLHHETDEKFGIDVSKTLDEMWILLSMRSHKTSEVRCLAAGGGSPSLLTIDKRREGVEYSVDHGPGGFIITHNDGALNFEIVTGLKSGARKVLVPHSPEVYLLGTLVFRDSLVIRTREKGVPVLRVRQWSDQWSVESEHRIEMPESSYGADLSTNKEFDSPTVRFSYSSMTTPQSVFEYDMVTRERKLLKEQPVPAYDRAKYETRLFYSAAADGEQVPVVVVHKRGLKLDGSNPTLLVAYGSYGSNSDATFSSNRLPLLDRGVVCAIAQIRGGSEKGRAWYEAGRMMNKKNTFTDFIAAAEGLINEGYTRPDRLAIRGGSAGGLLMGAVVNLRPDLFRVCVADVPFVDVVNTMLDPTLPLTVEEYDQWGNPNEKAAFEYIASYSPYDNVAARPYPAILATVGLNDSNVPYWEGAKWVQRLREATTSGRPVVLHVNLDTGHGGNSDRYKRLDEEAWRYAFVLGELRVK